MSLIDEEALELNELCTRLLLTAKIEAEQVITATDDIVASQLISQVVADRSVNFQGHAVEVSVPNEKLAVCGDRRRLGWCRSVPGDPPFLPAPSDPQADRARQ